MFTMFSCENSDYQKYDLSQKDGVFIFGRDSVFYNFGFDTKTEFVYNVELRLIGMPRDYDRLVKINVISDKYATENIVAAKDVYYEIPKEFIFPKNAVKADIPVKLLRNKDLENIRAILAFEIEKTEDLLIRGNSKYSITFDDKIPETPVWWADYKWGAFSKLKGQLFFKYFWEMEKENKYLYDKIVQRWGVNLDIPPLIYGNNPTNAYSYAFAKYVEMKMWKYAEKHPELKLNIKKPTIR